MSEIVRIRDQYYILATSPLADAQTRVLKHDETFAIFDLYGDIRRLGRGEQGLYHKGMRHMSRSVLRLGAERPLLLGSSVTEDNIVFAVDLTNPDMGSEDFVIPRGTVHIFRSMFLWDGCCYERFRLFNYAPEPVEVEMTRTIEADFADIFEVRGVQREGRGVIHDPEIDGHELVLRYGGLDGLERRTRVQPSPEGFLDGTDIRFAVEIPSRQTREVYLTITFEDGRERRTPPAYPSAIVSHRDSHERLAAQQAQIETSNELFNAWTARSLADLRMMTTNTSHGAFPYAGVPWFAAPFGRDALLTAYELLWIDATIARGVLGYLAHTQADEIDPERESEPGKILHEQRMGELAALGEVPFGSYYGSVDSTPLFVALAGEYLRFTGDIGFVRSIWPNIEAALEWIDRYGDADGDGFVEYRGSERGLIQQGWKDSHDAIFHRDGSMAAPPIALCEVQGYVFWAKRSAASAARALGFDERADALEDSAARLKESFEQAFWLPELDTYALALDGRKEPCAVRASNAGHCLTTGIADSQRARAVAEILLSDAFFSGWGIRTLATTEQRYGPITYHNGSIWPHDNAFIAQGLGAYGFKDGVHRIMSSLLQATEILEFHRLPELYCGFPRRPGQGPIEYPLACAPQAWAAGSVFLLLRACLGLSVEASERRIVFTRPTLPAWLREVHVRGIRAGDASADLTLHYHRADDVGVNVTNRSGGVEVVVVK